MQLGLRSAAAHRSRYMQHSCLGMVSRTYKCNTGKRPDIRDPLHASAPSSDNAQPGWSCQQHTFQWRSSSTFSG